MSVAGSGHSAKCAYSLGRNCVQESCSLGMGPAIESVMNAEQLVDAALDRAEQALASHDVDSLRWAELALMGVLDHAARQVGAEQLCRDVLRSVSQELRS